MKRYRDSKISARINSGYGIMLLIFKALGVTGLVNMNNAGRQKGNGSRYNRCGLTCRAVNPPNTDKGFSTWKSPPCPLSVRAHADESLKI